MPELAAACELPITPFGRAGARHLFRDGYPDPFGIAIVPLTMGKLTAGKLLVAEFGNQHGTAAAGTTILQVNPATGKTSVFFRGAPVEGPVAWPSTRRSRRSPRGSSTAAKRCKARRTSRSTRAMATCSW